MGALSQTSRRTDKSQPSQFNLVVTSLSPAMMFPIFNMPCLHNHHQPPVLHSRAPHDGEISSPAATGLAIGLILVALIVTVLVYFWCWRQQETRNHRREARHRRENQRDPAGQNAAGNGTRAAAAPDVQQVAQRRDDAAQGQQECPLPAVPLSIHHHQHDDKHFHGDQYHDHLHENDHILDCPDSNNDRNVQDNAHHQHNNHNHHHRHHHHRHHRFSRSHRTNRLIIPQDPLAEIERLFRSPSPGLPDINRADLEAILNGLDVPLPNEAAQRNANAQEQGAVRRDESKDRRKKRHHHHHHRQRHSHHRQKRVVVH